MSLSKAAIAMMTKPAVAASERDQPVVDLSTAPGVDTRQRRSGRPDSEEA